MRLADLFARATIRTERSVVTCVGIICATIVLVPVANAHPLALLAAALFALVAFLLA